MLKPISLACLVLSGALGCAADVAPTETGDRVPAPAEQTAEGQCFEVDAGSWGGLGIGLLCAFTGVFPFL